MKDLKRFRKADQAKVEIDLKQILTPNAVEMLTSEYQQLKEEIALLTKRKDELNKKLVARVKEEAKEGNSYHLTVGRFKLSAIESVRENFSLKEARKEIAEEELKPFIKESEVTQLRVKAVK